MKTIIFEWAEYENLISGIESIDWGECEFSEETFSVDAAMGFETVSIFVKSKITNEDIEKLAESGLRQIAIRAAGFDMIDVDFARSIGIKVFRVASYSPVSIAEHVFALTLTLSRKLLSERANHMKFRNEWALNSMGFTLQGKTIGLFGVGKIGAEVARIAKGFGMRIIYFDKYVESFPGCEGVDSLEALFSEADIVSVHVPLNDETRKVINQSVLEEAKPGLLLINTARGDVVDSDAVVAALDGGRLGGLGVDVWDSGEVDDKFDSRLLRDDVIQTYHIAFFTREAIAEILKQTHASINGNPEEKNVLA